jgi:hypothetical protein
MRTRGGERFQGMVVFAGFAIFGIANHPGIFGEYSISSCEKEALRMSRARFFVFL